MVIIARLFENHKWIKSIKIGHNIFKINMHYSVMSKSFGVDATLNCRRQFIQSESPIKVNDSFFFFFKANFANLVLEF